MTYKDEIIEEVWRWRDDYARRRRYSLKRIVADLREDHRARHAVAGSRRATEGGAAPPGTPPERP
ncbi:MAG: hypothetical protein FJX72_06745 [Armatimonadetes bacterium]|nr:hypothetical protein [Armatimonadota bacterium]